MARRVKPTTVEQLGKTVDQLERHLAKGLALGDIVDGKIEDAAEVDALLKRVRGVASTIEDVVQKKQNDHMIALLQPVIARTGGDPEKIEQLLKSLDEQQAAASTDAQDVGANAEQYQDAE